MGDIFFYSRVEFTNRVSFRKAADFIFEVLGQLLEISGVLLGIAGFSLVGVEASVGLPLAIGDLSVVLLIYGTISFLAGALMVKTVQHREDLEDQFDIALDSEAGNSHVTYTRPPPRVSAALLAATQITMEQSSASRAILRCGNLRPDTVSRRIALQWNERSERQLRYARASDGLFWS